MFYHVSLTDKQISGEGAETSTEKFEWGTRVLFLNILV